MIPCSTSPIQNEDVDTSSISTASSKVVAGNLFEQLVGSWANRGETWNANQILEPLEDIQHSANSLSLADFEETTLTPADGATEEEIDELAEQLKLVDLPEDWFGPAKDLITRFLDLKNPRLDDKMVESLEMNRFLELFLSFMTRVPDQDAPSNPTYPLRSTFIEDEDALRRSFNVMEILASPNPSSVRLVTEKGQEIVEGILPIFYPHSQGSFYHFKRVFDSMLQRQPNVMMETLYNAPSKKYVQVVPDSMGKPFLFEMLKYVQEPPVASAILTSLMFPATRVGNLTKMERFARMQKIGLIENALKLFLDAEAELKEGNKQGKHLDEGRAMGIADFLVRLVEDASKTDDSGILFDSLEHKPELLDPLVDIVRSKDYNSNQRKLATDVLHAFLFKAITKPPRPFFQMQDPSSRLGLDDDLPLKNLQEAVSKCLRSRLADICYAVELGQASPLQARNATVVQIPEFPDGDRRFSIAPQRGPTDAIQFSSYSVRRPFTASRLQLLEIMYEVMRPRYHSSTGKTPKSPISSGLLAQTYTDAELSEMQELYQLVPWKILVNWFFDYPQNNAFHTLFYKLIDIVLKTKVQAILKTVLTKCKLITRLMEAYNSKRHLEQRGFIILLLNAIRLAAEKDDQDANANHYIRQILSQTEGWQDFEPILKEATKQQIQVICGGSLIKSGLDFPMPCVTPLPPPLLPERGLNSRGLDLGSEYAACLGYIEPPKPVAPAPPKPKLNFNTSPVLGKGVSIRERLAMRLAAQQQAKEEVKAPPLDDASPAKKKKRKKRKSVSGSSDSGDTEDTEEVE